jgi:hypothetical protein
VAEVAGAADGAKKNVKIKKLKNGKIREGNRMEGNGNLNG